MDMRTQMIEEAKIRGHQSRLALRAIEQVIPAGRLLDVVVAVQNAKLGPLSADERALLTSNGLLHGNALSPAGEQIASLETAAA